MLVDSALLIEHAEFSENSSGLGGGAILLNSNSSIFIKHALFHDNTANSLSFRSFTSATVEAVVFYQDGASTSPYNNDHIILSDISSTTLKYVSMLDSEVGEWVFSAINGDPDNRVYNSVVYNSSANQLGIASTGAINVYDCVVSDQNETGTLVINAIDYDDLFVDKVNLDFRLQPNAMAIDLCDGSGNAAPSDVDLQGLTRGFDLPGISNISGIFDAGANELNNDYFFQK